MRFIILVASALAAVNSQRPPYAGTSAKGYPELASRFRDPNDTSAVSFNNRGGQEASNIPQDALGDVDLVNRLNQWPREHRPFWLLNADHIEAQRNPGKFNQSRIDITSRIRDNQNVKGATEHRPFASANQNDFGYDIQGGHGNFGNIAKGTYRQGYASKPGYDDRRVNGNNQPGYGIKTHQTGLGSQDEYGRQTGYDRFKANSDDVGFRIRNNFDNVRPATQRSSFLRPLNN